MPDMPDYFSQQVGALDGPKTAAVHTLIVGADHKYLLPLRIQHCNFLEHHPIFRMPEGNDVIYFQSIQKEGDFGDQDKIPFQEFRR